MKKNQRDIFEQLIRDKKEFVREVVAKNPNTPPDILEKLSNDEYDDVRAEVAANPNSTHETSLMV